MPVVAKERQEVQVHAETGVRRRRLAARGRDIVVVLYERKWLISMMMSGSTFLLGFGSIVRAALTSG